MNTLNIVFTFFAILVMIAGIFLYYKSHKSKIQLAKREKETQRQMYELAILKELGDRVGYSLNIQNIIDIITGSLHQFIDYSAVSYMLLEPEEIIFKVHLEKSISRDFIDEVKDRMLKSLSALLDKKLSAKQVQEVLSGAILTENIETPVKSFFNIPLVIGDKVVGVLTVAHTMEGLYKEEEMTILYKITGQASQAVTKLQEVVEIEQKKLNSMVESMSEGVIMTDKDYRIVVANPKAKEAVGIEDKKDVTIFDFIDKFSGAFDIRGKLEESVKLDKILETPEILLKDRFYQTIVSPVKSSFGMSKGETLGSVVILHDITQEKELEKMRDDFTSMMVHELRTPLDGIKKMTEMLKAGKIKPETESFTEYLSMIFDNSSGMLEMVNDLLDIAKLEAGKFELNQKPTPILPIFDDKMNFFTSLTKDKKIILKKNISEGLPEKAKFDGTRISQVLNNLISNSIKFTSPGGEITLQALMHNKGKDIKEEMKTSKIKWFIKDKEEKINKLPTSIIVAITDSGIGIPEEKIPELFNKFKQFQSTAVQSDKKGTGLGLAISKGIIESHKGTMGVESKEGEGSTFYFTIPVRK